MTAMTLRFDAAFAAAGPNALAPSRMSTSERLDEVSQIIALGIRRHISRKSRGLSDDNRDSSLDFTACQSLYGVNSKERNP